MTTTNDIILNESPVSICERMPHQEKKIVAVIDTPFCVIRKTATPTPENSSPPYLNQNSGNT